MNLNALFYPNSIAIIGASTKVGSVGNSVLQNLVSQGYKGKVFPVNPKGDVLYGLKCFKDISEINEEIDLAVIAIPAAAVPDILIQCGEKKVKAAIVISAGFKEIGLNDLENRVKEICQKYDIALIGPNCLGVIVPEVKMNASFAVTMPEDGDVAFISQSGALCTAVLDYAQYLGIGFSKFVSVGNKALITELELLDYLAKDPKTRVIAMYVEQLNDGKKLIEAVKKITKGQNAKPIIAIKAGKTGAGAAASASHTGALSGDDATYQALFDQCGIIRANRIEELFQFAQVLSDNRLSKGNNVAIITNAGGPGVLTTDEAINNGLNLAKLSEETSKQLNSILPPAANKHNPIDVLGDAKADRFKATLDVVEADPAVDGILVILTPQAMTQINETAEAIVNKKMSSSKPIIASFMGQKTVESGVEYMKKYNVSTMTFPEPAAKAMSTLMKFGSWSRADNCEPYSFTDIDKDAVRKIFDEAKTTGKKAFPEAEAMSIMRAYNFPLLKSFTVSSAAEAAQRATEMGGKVAMKIVSKDILHKSDVGGVMLNIEPADAAAKYDLMMKTVSEKAPQAKLEGVLLMEMAPADGTELILGSNKDPSLGSMIMVGLGGIYVEVFKDVSFGIVPLCKADPPRMIDMLKSKKILNGVRGQSKLDTEALIDCIGRLSQLLSDFPEIKELDINPLKVLPEGKGVLVLDVRIVIE